MGAFQLPDSVLGDAAGCIVYSFICLIANSILIWLVCTHNETRSYTAFIAYFTLLGTFSSIVQQFYDYAFWRDIMIQQYYYGKEYSENAEVQYQKGIFGLKLGLSYIRIFAFTVESTLVFFFAFSVASSLYGWWAKKPKTLRIISIIGRILPIVLAVLTIGILQAKVVQLHFFVYLFVANLQSLLSLAGACVLFLMVLYKYMQARWQLKLWGGVSYGTGGASTNASSGFRKSSVTFRATPNRKKHADGSFDNWLVIRLGIAFVMLCVFQYYSIAPRFAAKGHVVESAMRPTPDLSRKRALSSVRGYLTGVSPSMLAFVVFGTTRAFQRKMYTTFVPLCLRRNKGIIEPNELPFSHNSSHSRNSTLRPESRSIPARASMTSFSQNNPAPSIRRPETAARLSPIPDDPQEVHDDDIDDYSTYLRQSQIGLELNRFSTQQDRRPPSRHGNYPTQPNSTFYHSRSSSSPARRSSSTPAISSFHRNKSHSISHNMLLSRPQSRSSTVTDSTLFSFQPTFFRSDASHNDGESLPPFPDYSRPSSAAWGVAIQETPEFELPAPRFNDLEQRGRSHSTGSWLDLSK
ncbi:unnamed protein product [Periconia digitata]|uniref:Glycoside hydrolase n=1 Tax=Periconia digitata TaxID=1303443 RepID=A0A9W4UK14_9PLEO|nr:unnamed protein product [Periconia digitata]